MLYYQELRAQSLGLRAHVGPFIGVQQVTESDAVLLYGLLRQLSERTLQLRYMRGGQFGSEFLWKEAQRMARGFSSDHITLMATMSSNDKDEIVAIAELMREHADPTGAEIALVVRDDVQGQGIATMLLWRLIGLARSRGITHLNVNMLAENTVMLHVVTGLGLPFAVKTRQGETIVRVSLQRHLSTSAHASKEYTFLQ